LSGDDDLGGGCSVGSGASGSSLLFALFAVLFVIRRRRD
jgi:MYXO-CTERM domain-containing protein